MDAGNRALCIRKTLASDIDAVLEMERDPGNSPFIGQWSREQHAAVIDGAGEHCVIAPGGDSALVGYLIAYDLTAEGFGVWIQRIAVSTKSRGIGRAVLSAYLADAMSRLVADSAILDVMPTNLRAQRMYRALGFVEAGLASEERARLGDLVGGFDEDGIVMRLAGEALHSRGGHEVQIVG
ncbi:MAG: N-acetyltransferase [Dehalococcoidia bacterium]